MSHSFRSSVSRKIIFNRRRKPVGDDRRERLKYTNIVFGKNIVYLSILA